MGIDLDFWRNRIVNRIDLTTQLVHLTRPSKQAGDSFSAFENLFRILESRTIVASTRDSGFIVGTGSAVCFQDVPLYSLAQNIDHEHRIRREAKNPKLRYSPVGIMFSKPYVFSQGGRPVVYERTVKAKKILPVEEHWRIVNFDLSDRDEIVDWTHEREWRVPGDFEFDLGEATVIVASNKMFNQFAKRCQAMTDEEEINYLAEVKSVINLGAVLL